MPAQTKGRQPVGPRPFETLSTSYRDGPKDQTSDAQLRIGESRDSPMCNCTSECDASHRPGMTVMDCFVAWLLAMTAKSLPDLVHRARQLTLSGIAYA